MDEKNLEAVITARTDEYEAGKSEEELVKEALEHSHRNTQLSELVKGKNRIVLVTSDHTRAVPSKLTLLCFWQRSAKEIRTQILRF